MDDSRQSARRFEAERPRILCVDDEPEILSALRRVFRSEPVELLTTGSPYEALDWVARRHVSVLITDHRMPGMTGIELMQAVVDRSPHTRLVMITAFPDIGLFRECERRGARTLLTKPWDDEGLRCAISMLLRESEAS